MTHLKKITVITALLFSGVFLTLTNASAMGCDEYTEAPSSASAATMTIIDTEVGTDAYQRLVVYSNGGHKALGMAIASQYDYFGQCQYAGIGIMDGSGGNGFRPNYTLAIWHDSIDLSVARSAIYSLIGAGSNPTVTNGDCNISCDGTTGRQFDGTIVNETTTTTTTTQVPNEQIDSGVSVTSPTDSTVTEVIIPTTVPERIIASAPQADAETTTTTTVVAPSTTTTTVAPVSVMADSFVTVSKTTVQNKQLIAKKKAKKRVLQRTK